MEILTIIYILHIDFVSFGETFYCMLLVGWILEKYLYNCLHLLSFVSSTPYLQSFSTYIPSFPIFPTKPNSNKLLTTFTELTAPFSPSRLRKASSTITDTNNTDINSFANNNTVNLLLNSPRTNVSIDKGWTKSSVTYFIHKIKALVLSIITIQFYQYRSDELSITPSIHLLGYVLLFQFLHTLDSIVSDIITHQPTTMITSPIRNKKGNLSFHSDNLSDTPHLSLQALFCIENSVPITKSKKNKEKKENNNNNNNSTLIDNNTSKPSRRNSTVEPTVENTRKRGTSRTRK